MIVWSKEIIPQFIEPIGFTVSFPDLGILAERILRILATSLGMVATSVMLIG